MRELQALCLDVATYKIDVYNGKKLNDYETDLMGEPLEISAVQPLPNSLTLLNNNDPDFKLL